MYVRTVSFLSKESGFGHTFPWQTGRRRSRTRTLPSLNEISDHVNVTWTNIRPCTLESMKRTGNDHNVFVLLGMPQSGLPTVREYLKESGAMRVRDDPSRNNVISHPVEPLLTIDKDVHDINSILLDIDYVAASTRATRWLDTNRFENRPLPDRDEVTERLAPDWVSYGFDSRDVSPQLASAFHAKAEAYVQKMTARRGDWILSDPAVHLTAPFWAASLRGVGHVVCVRVVRSPLGFAESMLPFARHGRLSLREWSHVWESYARQSVGICDDRPTIYVPFDRLAADPHNTLRDMHDVLERVVSRRMNSFGTMDITTIVSRFPITSYVPYEPEDSFSKRMYDEQVSASAHLWHAATTSLLRTVHDGSSLTARGATCTMSVQTAPGIISWPSLDRIVDEAYATIVTGDASSYVSGAVVTGLSISAMDSSRDMVALVTHKVSDASVGVMKYFGWKVWRIDTIDEMWFGSGRNKKCVKHMSSDQKVRWGRMTSKLRLWQLRYSKVLYMDADAFVAGTVQDVFDTYRDHDIVGESSVRWNHVFLAGVMFLSPSDAMFERLIARSHGSPPDIWHGNVDCTEQALLNDVFKDVPTWKKKFSITKTSRESIGRPTLPRQWPEDAPWIEHYLTKSCAKPWTRFYYNDVDVRIKSKCDRMPTLLWERKARVAGLVPGAHPFSALPNEVAFRASNEEDVMAYRYSKLRRRHVDKGH